MCKRLRLGGRNATSTSQGGGKFFGAFFVTVGLFLALFGLVGAPSAFATGGSTTQVVHAKSLSQSCPEGQTTCGAYFVITQIGSDAPASIEVKLSDGTTHTVELLTINGQTAKYQLKFTAGLTVTGATAVVPADWSGQFNLSHYLCKESETPPVVTPKNPTVTAAAESCVKPGEYDGKVTGSVTNTADDTKQAATYTVKLLDVDGNVVDQTKVKDVADGASAPYAFTGLTPSEYKVKVVGSDGTRASTTVTVEECSAQVALVPEPDVSGGTCEQPNISFEFGDTPHVTVSPNSGTIKPGQRITVTYTADEGWAFEGGETVLVDEIVNTFDVTKCAVTPPPTHTTPPVTPPVVTPPVTPPVVTPPVTPPVVTPPVTPPVVVPPVTRTTTHPTPSAYPVAAHAGGSGVAPWQKPTNMASLGFGLLLIAFGLSHIRARRAQGSSRRH